MSEFKDILVAEVYVDTSMVGKKKYAAVVDSIGIERSRVISWLRELNFFANLFDEETKENISWGLPISDIKEFVYDLALGFYHSGVEQRSTFGDRQYLDTLMFLSCIKDFCIKYTGAKLRVQDRTIRPGEVLEIP